MAMGQDRTTRMIDWASSAFSSALSSVAKQMPGLVLLVAATVAMFFVSTRSSERISLMAAQSFAAHTTQVSNKIDRLIEAVTLLAEKQDANSARTYEILGTLSEVVRSNTLALQQSADARNRLADALNQLGTVQSRMEGILTILIRGGEHP